MVFGTRNMPFDTMLRKLAVVVSIVHAALTTHEFPSNFKFGAATASYQIEGGWNADGKGASIWDRLCHSTPSPVLDGETGDTAADSYHRWREDVRICKHLGLQFYRFSISWPRILPNGFSSVINETGVKYYSDLIDALQAEGVEPIITMYHWDLPVAIQDLGGWTNPLIVGWFGDYARILFSRYADRVKTWITINEAISVCDFNYNFGTFAPRVQEKDFGPFLCNRHILLAHAVAYRMYEELYRDKYKGKISLANNILWMEPATPADNNLAELGRQHAVGRYSHPIFSKTGGWPPSIEEEMLKYSLKQGYNTSRLPEFSEQEKLFIKGTADFYSVNYYTTYLIRPERPDDAPGEWFLTGSPEIGAILEPLDSVKGASQIVMPINPKGLRRLLNWLREEYGDIDIFIAENGFSTKGHELEDFTRVDYIQQHLQQIMLAIKEDNISVIGYTVWSLLDNFEWLDGYSTKFGLYNVDFDSLERTRTPRASAYYYKCIIGSRSLNDSCIRRTKHMPKSNKSPEIERGTIGIIIVLLAILFI